MPTESTDPDAYHIRKAMDRRGMNAADLARAAGLSTAVVYDFLAGKSDPRGATRRKMLAAAGVVVTYTQPPKVRGAKARGPGRPAAE